VPWLIALNMGGLGHAAAATGDVTSARSYFRHTLSKAQATGSPSTLLYALVGFASLKAQAGEPLYAAEWLGLVLGHPSRETDVLTRAETLLSELRGALPADELDAALERGKALDLEMVVREIVDAQGCP
jgi:hypothetical protein